MNQLTFGSVFSGAGGVDIGFERGGLSPAFQCEIDPQASSVLAKHWPLVARYGDIRTLRQKDVGRVDVLAGGFPCQDLSVAGKREGLKGERSGLFYELLRVAKLCRPRFVVWENVPGLLSSDDGRDFARVLRGLADIGYFGAWRVLDAKYFGVPQRRRRVFGVFARGRSGAVRCAEILALTQSVCRDSAAGQEAGKDVAFTLTSSVGRNSGGTRVGNAWNTNYVVARCLTSSDYRSDGETDNFVCFTGETTRALTGGTAATLGTSGSGLECGPSVIKSGVVRRLTPREYERLMGWPDDWTKWGDAGNEFADGPRYRMCGNGVVSNCAEWIGRRLIESEQGVCRDNHNPDLCRGGGRVRGDAGVCGVPTS